MVKPAGTSSSLLSRSQYDNSKELKYKGVRKRKWGKWVSEIRLPNSRERIWLGSYDSPEKAARAFDAALYCLRGSAASFNFPDDPPSPDVIGGEPSQLGPQEIQAVAARYANYHHAATRQGEEEGTRITTTTTLLSPRDGNENYSNTTSDEHGVVSSTTTTTAAHTTMDWSFLGMLDCREQAAVAAATSDHHFELFSGMDNTSMSMDMNMGGSDYYHDPHHMMFDANDVINYGHNHQYHHDEMAVDDAYSQSHPTSFLWNF